MAKKNKLRKVIFKIEYLFKLAIKLEVYIN